MNKTVASKERKIRCEELMVLKQTSESKMIGVTEILL